MERDGMSAVTETDSLRNEVARLRKGIQDFLDGNYENPRLHRPSKCGHGRLWFEGCDECDAAHFEKLLG
jgi:hypothetical protein